jgi:hypothetical protein
MSFNDLMQKNSTLRQALPLISKSAFLGAIALVSLGWSGCSTTSAMRYSPQAVAAMSPTAEVVQPFEAMALAKKYVAAHPGTDFLVGSGDSMLPLYQDHTVVVTKKAAIGDLQAGMTAVFLGDSGRPVAHVLVARTSDGWVAQGVGNLAPDATLVTADNLMGVVIKAYQPSSSPMLALANEAASKAAVASLP